STKPRLIAHIRFAVVVKSRRYLQCAQQRRFNGAGGYLLNRLLYIMQMIIERYCVFCPRAAVADPALEHVALAIGILLQLPPGKFVHLSQESSRPLSFQLATVGAKKILGFFNCQIVVLDPAFYLLARWGLRPMLYEIRM